MKRENLSICGIHFIKKDIILWECDRNVNSMVSISLRRPYSVLYTMANGILLIRLFTKFANVYKFLSVSRPLSIILCFDAYSFCYNNKLGIMGKKALQAFSVQPLLISCSFTHTSYTCTHIVVLCTLIIKLVVVAHADKTFSSK